MKCLILESKATEKQISELFNLLLFPVYEMDLIDVWSHEISCALYAEE